MDPLGADRLHLDIEAALAWPAATRHVADPARPASRSQTLLSEETAARLAGIDPHATRIRRTEAAVAMPRSDTVYLSVVDKDRNGRVVHQFGLLTASAAAS